MGSAAVPAPRRVEIRSADRPARSAALAGQAARARVDRSADRRSAAADRADRSRSGVREVAVTYLGIVRDDPRRKSRDWSRRWRTGSLGATGGGGCSGIGTAHRPNPHSRAEEGGHRSRRDVQREAGRTLVHLAERKQKSSPPREPGYFLVKFASVSTARSAIQFTVAAGIVKLLARIEKARISPSRVRT